MFLFFSLKTSFLFYFFRLFLFFGAVIDFGDSSEPFFEVYFLELFNLMISGGQLLEMKFSYTRICAFLTQKS